MTTIMRRTEIRIEQRTRLIIRRRISTFCQYCGRQTITLTTGEVAALFQTTIADLGDFAEAGEIHFVETPANESTLICGESFGLKSSNFESSR